jgi:hypothetical protein
MTRLLFLRGFRLARKLRQAVLGAHADGQELGVRWPHESGSEPGPVIVCMPRGGRARVGDRLANKWGCRPRSRSPSRRFKFERTRASHPRFD